MYVTQLETIGLRKTITQLPSSLMDVRVLRYEEGHELRKKTEQLENEISRKDKSYEEYRQQVKVHEDARDKLRMELKEANEKMREIDQLLHASKKEHNELQVRLDEERIERTSLAKQYEELRGLYTVNEREKLELQSRVKSCEDIMFKNETVKEALEHDLQEVILSVLHAEWALHNIGELITKINLNFLFLWLFAQYYVALILHEKQLIKN